MKRTYANPAPPSTATEGDDVAAGRVTAALLFARQVVHSRLSRGLIVLACLLAIFGRPAVTLLIDLADVLGPFWLTVGALGFVASVGGCALLCAFGMED